MKVGDILSVEYLRSLTARDLNDLFVTEGVKTISYRMGSDSVILNIVGFNGSHFQCTEQGSTSVGTWGLKNYEIEILAMSRSDNAAHDPDLQTNNKENNINSMSKITNYIKRIGLDKEDKLLLDLGLEDPKGVPTAEGLEVMASILYSENRDKLKKVAVEMDAEEKKDKE